jgi:hypothetical protein
MRYTLKDIKKVQPHSAGFLEIYFNRKISRYITYVMLKMGITPNQVNFLSFFISVVAAGFLATGEWSYLIVAAVLIQLSYTLDCCDGEIARLKKMANAKGAWQDSSLDRISEVVLFAALGLGIVNQTGDQSAWMYTFFGFCSTLHDTCHDTADGKDFRCRKAGQDTESKSCRWTDKEVRDKSVFSDYRDRSAYDDLCDRCCDKSVDVDKLLLYRDPEPVLDSHLPDDTLQKMKPNFFMVGAPKCGTTAIYAYLKQHPDVFMPYFKEPNYFCRDMHKESDRHYGSKKYFSIRTEKQYMELYKDWDGQKMIGDATPDHLYSKEAAKHIYEFNPKAKILIFVRDPVDFIYSFHSQALFFSGEWEKDFRKALGLEEQRKKGKKIPPGVSFPSFLFYSERVKFSEQIKRYLDIFPKKNIKIVLFDDFKKDNRKVYKDIVRFLGIDDEFEPEYKILNPSKVPRSMAINYLFTFLSNLSIKRLIPTKIKYYISRMVKISNTKKSRRRPMDPRLKEELIKKFTPEVKALSKIVGRDLMKLWGYR